MGRFSIVARRSLTAACLISYLFNSHVAAQLIIPEIAPNAEIKALEHQGGGESFEIRIVSQKDMHINGYTIEPEASENYTLFFNYDISDCSFKNRTYWDNPCFSPFYCELDVICPPAIEDTVNCITEIPLAVSDTTAFRVELGGQILSSCDDVVITHQDSISEPFDPKHQRNLHRKYLLTDGIDTSYCTLIYPVINRITPTLVMMTDTIYLSSDGTLALIPIDFISRAYDTCNDTIETASITPDFIDGNDLGNLLIEVSIVDTASNETIDTMTIVVLDNTPPQVMCPGDTIIMVPPCICESSFTFTDPPTHDENGDQVTIERLDSTGLKSGDFFPAGTTTLSYSATDESGNSTICSYDVTVESGDPGPIQLMEQVNFSLSETCDGYPTAIMFLEANPPCGEDSYSISVLDSNGNRIDEDSLRNYRNQVLEVLVEYTCFENSATSSVLIEDKYAPVINCVSDTVTCDSFFHFEIPEALDNCDNQVELIMINETIQNVSCSDPNLSRIVTRTFVAIDHDNRRDTCVQTLSIEKFDLTTVEFSGIDTTIYCANNTTLDENGNPSPSIAGFPITGTTPLWPDQNSICNVTSNYTDINIPGNSCGRSIVRQWSVMYWDCFQDGMVSFMQTINIVDNQGPTFSCPDTLIVSTDPFTCTAQISQNLPMAQDDCNSVERFEINYPNSYDSNATSINETLELGTNEIIISAFDSCGNKSSCSWIVIVEDNDNPNVITNGGFTVQLTGHEQTVNASQIDQGSFDNCGFVTVEILRMATTCDTTDLQASPSITICCDDVGTDVMVMVIVTDAAGNTGQGMVVLSVEDDTAPVLVFDLPDITISCDYNYIMGETDDFGTIVNQISDRDSILIDADSVIFSGQPLDALVNENCGMTVTQSSINENVSPSCGTGTVTRVLTVTDESGNSIMVDQTITFVNFFPFNNDDVSWPPNFVTQNVCTPNELAPNQLDPPYAEPILSTDKCDDVAVGIVDDVDYGPFVSDTLFIINRQWSAADWCQNNNGQFLTLDSTQTITVLNTIQPAIVGGCTEIIECNTSTTCEDVIVALSINAMDDCTSAENISYYYEIDINSDNNVDATGSTNSTSFGFPIGDHMVKWLVTDQQGNQDICFQPVTINNCNIPSPICIEGLTFALMGVDTDNMGGIDDEQVTINVNQIDGGSSNACNIPFVLSFTTDTTKVDTVFDCSSLGTQQLSLYITDQVTGVQDFCTTSVEIIDTNDVAICVLPAGPQLAISGMITSEMQKPTNGVTMLLLGGETSIQTEEGSYTFDLMDAGGNYIVEPHHETYPTDGITTYDLLLIQKHILGIKTFDSPYKYLAADVNGSEHISGADIIVLRKLLLGSNSEFQNQDSWQFVLSDHTFIDEYNPWLDAMTNYEIAYLESDMDINFISIKTGDVNNSSINLTDSEIETRSAIFMDYTIEHQNQELIIPVYISELDNLEGMQFSFKYNHKDYSFKEFLDGEMKIMRSFYSTKDQDLGVIDLSWINPDMSGDPESKLDKNKVAFYLIMDCVTEGKAANNLELQVFSEGLTSEAYFNDESKNKIEFRAISDEEASNIELYQNRPNPWNKNTIISFYLPSRETATLTINDVTGRQIYRRTSTFEEGMNEITIDATNLGNAGIYYYSLKTDTYQNMKKMILID